MQWTDLVNRISVFVPTPLSSPFVSSAPYNDPNWNYALPAIIEYAEGLIYREPEFDFLATYQSDITQVTTPGSRVVPIPSSFIVISKLNIIVPINTTLPSQGTRVLALRTSREYLDLIWPQEAFTQAPTQYQLFWALFNEQETAPTASSALIAPTPDGVYTVEFLGTFRPSPMSATNPTTFLGTYLPDLFWAACAIAVCGWMKNYAAAGADAPPDDPKSATHWMAIYQQLKTGAAVEEARKKSKGMGATSYGPSAVPAAARS